MSRSLRIEILPNFAGAPLVFDALTNITATGQTVSVTRLDFLLSNFALRRADGAWHTASNHFAYLSGREQRTTFVIPSIPSGEYDRVRFCVGVPEHENHASPGSLAANHPLNPNVNGLHWNWRGGYVFLAIEGDWIKPDGKRSGYSYHLATDRLLMAVEIPLKLDLTTDRQLRLALNLDQFFANPHRLRIADHSASTHSRAADTIADQLHENVPNAFVVDRIRSWQPPSHAAHSTNTIEMATNAVPYRLTFSRFFPQPALPLDNPLTEEGVELGRQLFHDPSLSINNSQSCASCHRADAAFTDSRRYSLGAEGLAGTRNAMPLFNLAWKRSFFWDGRASSLRDQVLRPIQDSVEMHETLTNVMWKLNTVATNGVLFARAFGTSEINADRIARALEQFLLTRVSHRSRFDLALTGETELTDEEKRGLELFNTEYDPRHGQFGADCFHCHGGPLFQSQSFANNGLDAVFKDLGRTVATGQSGDRGKFAVPSLRNVAVTAPYMHDGRFQTLDEVVDHYSTGVQRTATLDPNLAKHPDGGVPLSLEDRRALLAFLRTLTDEPFLTNDLGRASR